MNRRLLLSGLGAGLALPWVRPAGAQALTRATLRLKWLTQTQFAGFYIAVQKGYYREVGIDLTINPGGPNLLTSPRANATCPSSAPA